MEREYMANAMAEGMEKMAEELGLDGPTELCIWWDKQPKEPLYMNAITGEITNKRPTDDNKEDN